jgi:diguanylate cyclase (GGDEF)-like protein/PAS domain S-box-containing protein
MPQEEAVSGTEKKADRGPGRAKGAEGDNEFERAARRFADNPRRSNLAFIVSAIYSLAGIIWIYASDRLLALAHPPFAVLMQVQTSKGLIYVVLTALLLYGLLRAFSRTLIEDRSIAMESLARLEFALAASGGGVWNTDLAAGRQHLSKSFRQILGMEDGRELSIEKWMEIVHPEDRDIINGTMSALFRRPDLEHSCIARVRHGKGHYIWLSLRGRGIVDDKGRVARITGVATDITETRMAEHRAEELAYFDALTGLPNQRMFREELEKALHKLSAARDDTLVVCRLDLDRFVDINTALGVAGGDEVLRLVGQKLRKTCGASGLVTRLAADEFGILLTGLATPCAIHAEVKRLDHAIREPIRVMGTRLDLTASLGVTIAPWDGSTPEALMINADLALNRARKSRNNELAFYATGMNEDFRERALLARDLHAAIRDEAFEVYFQPIIRAFDRRLVGFEALARWTHKKRGIVSPTEFISLAEEMGLISQITQFMLREACQHMALWNRHFGENWFIAVNLSARQLCSLELDKEVAATLKTSGLKAQCLELEITENALTDNMETAAATLGRLRKLGVSLSIDDFGTGYSSLVALRRLPVSKLKIDRSFMENYGLDAENTAIVNSIIQLAHSLDLELTAEGIEDEQTFQQIRAQGCQNVQGYLFGYPDTAPKTLEFIQGVMDAKGALPCIRPLSA